MGKSRRTEELWEEVGGEECCGRRLVGKSRITEELWEEVGGEE